MYVTNRIRFKPIAHLEWPCLLTSGLAKNALLSYPYNGTLSPILLMQSELTNLLLTLVTNFITSFNKAQSSCLWKRMSWRVRCFVLGVLSLQCGGGWPVVGHWMKFSD